MRIYVSGCVRVNAYNLILILHRIIMLPGPGPGPVLCIIYMTRERQIILKAALHSRLAVLAAASYIIMLYCLDYS